MHLSTRPNGHMRVCCTANASSVQHANSAIKVGGGEVGVLRNENGRPANLNHTSLLEAWNNDYMKGVRTQMLNGEKPASCLKCYKEEEAGHQSKRQWETAYWMERFDLDEILRETTADGAVPPKIRYLDLRLGSKCQLACVMCSPHDSSGWIKDWQTVFPIIENAKLKNTSQWENKGSNDGASYNWHKKNPEFWAELYEQIPNMYQLYFAGGEATVIEEHYTLLEECVKRGFAGQIELRYNSNGVELPDRLFALWEHFRLVRFHYSIDAHGPHNDYIRYPSVWENQVENFWKLDNTSAHIEVTVACTVLALNIYYIPDFIKWKVQQGFKKINPSPLGAGMINFHFAYWPPQLNVKVLPKWFKDEVVRKYEEEFFPWIIENWRLCCNVQDVTFEEWAAAPYGLDRIKGLLRFMQAEDWSERMPEFVEYIKLTDKVQGKDFVATFPEMAKLLEHGNE